MILESPAEPGPDGNLIIGGTERNRLGGIARAAVCVTFFWEPAIAFRYAMRGDIRDAPGGLPHRGRRPPGLESLSPGPFPPFFLSYALCYLPKKP